MHGEVVARLEPEVSTRDAARARLTELRKAAPIGDVSSPIPQRWSAQHDDWAMNAPARKAAKKAAKSRRGTQR